MAGAGEDAQAEAQALRASLHYSVANIAETEGAWWRGPAVTMSIGAGLAACGAVVL